MDRGAYAEFDHIGKEFYLDSADFIMDTDWDRVEALAELVGGGYEKRLLISHDFCFKMDLVAYGGWGYAHILNHIVPMMLRRGISRQVHPHHHGRQSGPRAGHRGQVRRRR